MYVAVRSCALVYLIRPHVTYTMNIAHTLSIVKI